MDIVDAIVLCIICSVVLWTRYRTRRLAENQVILYENDQAILDRLADLTAELAKVERDTEPEVLTKLVSKQIVRDMDALQRRAQIKSI